MRSSPTFLAAVAIAALVAPATEAAPGTPAGPDPAARIRAETERLQKDLKEAAGDDPEVAQANAACADALRGAADAIGAGRLYLSLEMLGRAADLRAGAGVKAGLPAFESEWKQAGLDLAALDREAAKRDWSRSRVAVRAIAETAQGRALPLLEGARGFAVATKPRDGLFYLGEARGEAGFAQFCAALEFPGKTRPIPLRSMLPELQRLQEKSNVLFKPPLSIDLHPRFIALNSTLKLAQELDATRAYAGSTYQYLEAVRHYGMLEAPPIDAAAQATLTRDLAAARTRLESSGVDESLGGLFLERAGSQIAHADGSAPSVDEWRSARVIVDQVLPAYLAARTPATSRAARAATGGGAVTMTLVRWPYT